MSKPRPRLLLFAVPLLGSFSQLHAQTAATHEDDVPSSYDGREISDNGPDAPAGQRDASLLRTSSDRDYTYMRCWYRKDASDLNPRSDYVWARIADGSYYLLRGYWYDNFVFRWRNMFYTSTARAELEQVCRDTLRRQGLPATLFDLHAADNRRSFNYLIWTYGEQQGGTSINRMVSFGDSLSDTMNLYNGSLWKMPNRKSWLLGRFSNGPLWNEQVAAALRIPLYNWSVGGAAGDQHMVIPGVREQVASWKQYMRVARDYQPARTLFTLWIGANDIINYGRSVDSIALHVEASLRDLIAQGAKHLLVMNLPDLTLAPGLRTSTKKAQVAGEVAAYNQQLRGIVDRLQQQHRGVRLVLMDNFPLLDEVAADPESHGLTNFVDACLQIDYGSALAYTREHRPRRACTRADQHFFWDGLHPTTKGHQILAQKVTSFVLGNFHEELSEATQ
ncbi:SGNH/GDSL hydrolase family protein [Dyella sp. 2RAB6]|uniref:SGNH/GDSL hydrolase family protein n=1 Tax=Dyella sp. 2RAB6 TaxID=3232992 RepID=UPI003F8E231D